MTTKIPALHEVLTPWASKEQVAAYEEAVAKAQIQGEPFPADWDDDILFGPTDEELIARGSMPPFPEEDDEGRIAMMEKQAKEAGELPDWFYEGEQQAVCPVQTSFSWWKPAPEEDISNLGWDEVGGAYIDD